MKWLIKLIIFLSLLMLVSVTALSTKDNAPQSLADHIHLAHPKDYLDKGWVADITGLPSVDEVSVLAKHVDMVMEEDSDKSCNAISWRLRKMIFLHFVIYQHMANVQSVYFNEQVAKQWSHILAMILKESSGDTTSITAMSGRSISTYQAKTDLSHWRRVLSLSKQSDIALNYQTNFGLSQVSADRLFITFRLAKSKLYDTEYLEGREGAETPRKIVLNTAIAIRRLIWFYQDFAKGRIEQSQGRIRQEDRYKPEYYKRYDKGLELALLYCGTNFLFQEGYKNTEAGLHALKKAMDKIAYCKLGNPRSGYGVNEMDERCFASWVTLCPSLNVDIAFLTPLSYFETRDAKPLCEASFKRLLNKNIIDLEDIWSKFTDFLLSVLGEKG